MGIKNLQRVAKMLLAATTSKEGESYDDLDQLYGRMLGQWTLELSHVAAIVGGFNSQQKRVGQDGVRFTPVAKARQMEAVKFLNENAFSTPTWALDKDILRRIEPIGALNRVRNAQNSVLNNLLSSARFARLVEQQALDGEGAYQPAEFLADVRKGIWSELDRAAWEDQRLSPQSPARISRFGKQQTQRPNTGAARWSSIGVCSVLHHKR